MPNGDHGYSSRSYKYKIRCPTCSTVYIWEAGSWSDGKVGDKTSIGGIGGLCLTETCYEKGSQDFVVVAVGREKIEWET